MYDPARDIFTASEDAPDDESAEPNNNRADDSQQAESVKGMSNTENNMKKDSNNVRVC